MRELTQIWNIIFAGLSYFTFMTAMYDNHSTWFYRTLLEIQWNSALWWFATSWLANCHYILSFYAKALKIELLRFHCMFFSYVILISFLYMISNSLATAYWLLKYWAVFYYVRVTGLKLRKTFIQSMILFSLLSASRTACICLIDSCLFMQCLCPLFFRLA